MFDFPRWGRWLEQKVAEIADEGFGARLIGPAYDLPKPKLGFEVEGKKALGLFENWGTGETDYTILLLPDLNGGAQKWCVIATDETFRDLFEEFMAQMRRFEAL